MGHNKWEDPEERKRDVKCIRAIDKEVAMYKETGIDSNEFGIWAWIMYGRVKVQVFRIVKSYRLHKRMKSRANDTVYQHQRTFLISMGKPR